MKMRWVLTLKGIDDNPGKVKRKARMVLLGFSDPDMLELPTSAPIMSRRSRQLVLGLTTHQALAAPEGGCQSGFSPEISS